MGNNVSSSRCLVERGECSTILGDDEYRDILQGFKRLSRGTGCIGRLCFKNKVLGEHWRVPQTFSDRIFHILDVDASGELDEDEFIRGIATFRDIIRRRDLNRLCTFLFIVYDIEQHGVLNRDGLQRFIQVIYGRSILQSPTTVFFLDTLFESSPHLTYEAFFQSIQQNQSSLLIEWVTLFAQSIGSTHTHRELVLLGKRYEPEHIRQVIVECTELSRSEIAMLETHFPLDSRQDCGRLKALFCPEFITQEFADVLFSTASIDFHEFCVLLSMLTRGTPTSRLTSLYLFFAANYDTLQYKDACRLISAIRAAEDEKKQVMDSIQQNGREMSVEEFLRFVDKYPIVNSLVESIITAACLKFQLSPVDYRVERKIIDTYWTSDTTTYCLIAIKWWNSWNNYTNEVKDSEELRTPPGPISNWCLLKRSGSRELRPNLNVGVDFQLVPVPVYQLLHQWYKGGPELIREMIQEKDEIELHPQLYRIALVDRAGRTIMTGEEVCVSLNSTYEAIMGQISSILLLSKDKKVRLWKNNELVLPDLSNLMHSSTNEPLVVEIQSPDRSWPLKKTYGLINLGNTCYMSSALQCLIHTSLLTQFFETEAYLHDVNTTTKDGIQGRLALAFGHLTSEIRKINGTSPLAPKQFKKLLGSYNADFAGQDQQDASEFLAFLLSGLSEDLNRIENKPYIEQPDSNGRSDHVVADEWWRNHLKREVSIIVALFTGQFKSLLTCETCKHESARFEPFSILSLPLVEASNISLVVTIIFKTSRKPIRCCVDVLKTGTIEDLLQSLPVKLKEKCLIDLTKRKLFALSDNISTIRESDNLIVYELDPIVSKLEDIELRPKQVVELITTTGETVRGRVLGLNSDTGTYRVGLADDKIVDNVSRTRLKVTTNCFLYLLHRKVESSDENYFLNPYHIKVFGTPFVVRIVPHETTGEELYAMVLERIRRLFKWRSVDTFPMHCSSPKSSNDIAAPSTLYDVAAGEHESGWGFTIRYVTSTGTTCSKCPWINGCLGCVVSPEAQVIDCNETVAIDWDFETLTTDYDLLSATELDLDPSLEKKDSETSLEESLELFTCPETIDEGYCGQCASFQPSTKLMEIWRVPPILIIHLKRFQ